VGPVAEWAAHNPAALPKMRGYAPDGTTTLHLRFDQPGWQAVCTRPPRSMPQTGSGWVACGALRRSIVTGR
jgi:hypothetical protein